jgi:acyl-coenzyme A synthetase/AMP-(fatty) acid ligase
VTPAGIDGDALRAWAKQRLTPYQVPARVVALDELPRTPSSKVSLHLVRELLVESDKKE